MQKKTKILLVDHFGKDFKIMGNLLERIIECQKVKLKINYEGKKWDESCVWVQVWERY